MKSDRLLCNTAAALSIRVRCAAKSLILIGAFRVWKLAMDVPPLTRVYKINSYYLILVNGGQTGTTLDVYDYGRNPGRSLILSPALF